MPIGKRGAVFALAKSWLIEYGYMAVVIYQYNLHVYTHCIFVELKNRLVGLK